MAGLRSSGSFYFINKSDASASLSKSSSAETAKIQSYVQSGRKRHRKSKKATQSNQATLQTGLSTIACRADKGDFRESAPTHPRSSVAQSQQGILAHGEDNTDGPAAHRLSLIRPTRLNTGDPFDVASVRVDRVVSGLLHYYVHYYHPVLWPNEMIVLKHGLYTFQDAVKTILQMAVSNKLAMYSLLSAATCRMQYIDHLPWQSITGKQDFYIYRALQLLGSHIMGGGADSSVRRHQLLICIMFLLSAEAYRDDIAAAETHLQAVVALLDPVGGISSVHEEALKNQLAMADLFIACVRLRPCLFDCSYDPGPPNSLRLVAHELFPPNQGGPDTQSLLTRCHCAITTDLRTQIEQLQESYAVKCRLRTEAMSPERALAVTHWITTRNMAIRNRLLALTGLNPLANALRVATIMWSLLAMNVTGRTKTVKIMAPTLQALLSSIPAEDGAGCRDPRLWIAVVGYQCSSPGSSTSTWFIDQVRSQRDFLMPAMRLHGHTYEQEETELARRLEELQRSFFFDAEIQRSRTGALARHLVRSQC